MDTEDLYDDVRPVATPDRPHERSWLSRVRKWWPLLLLVLLLGWWGVSRLTEGSSSPGQLAVPTGPTTVGVQPVKPGSVGDGQAIAQKYETLMHQGDVKGTCALAARPEPCIAGFGSTPTRFVMVEPVHVVQAEPVTVPSGIGGAAPGTAVLVQFQIEGQKTRQVALLVQDGKVTKRVTVGSRDAGRTLTDLILEKR